jgi:CSLREA domain-containing protein
LAHVRHQQPTSGGLSFGRAEHRSAAPQWARDGQHRHIYIQANVKNISSRSYVNAPDYPLAHSPPRAWPVLPLITAFAALALSLPAQVSLVFQPKRRTGHWQHLIARLVLALLLGTLGAALFIPQPTYAAGIAVTTTTDELNSDGDCSLREAIQAANTDTAVDACPAGSGADTITLPAGTYTLTLAGAGEDANATGDLDITGDVTITGAGAGTTIIDGNATDRVLQIIGTSKMHINNITLRNGNLGTSNIGGGIYTDGPLTLAGSAIRANTAARGGGIYSTNVLTITASSLTNNQAPYTGSGTGVGGGLEHHGATLALINSTISNNIGGHNSGGFRSAGTATITNTTITNNTGPNFGGGLYVEAGGNMTLANSIIASNTGGNCQAAGTLVSHGYNLSDTNQCNLTNAGDVNNTNPKLSVLQDNGGGMLTRTLLPGSPAIDIIPNGVNGCGTTVTTNQPLPAITVRLSRRALPLPQPLVITRAQPSIRALPPR